jgi:putative colanic acid biosynthesis acetyltransferase WcaF
MLLRLFGARIHSTAVVHASVRIWAPWNVEMAAHSSLSHFVDCYAVDRVRIGAFATVSQYCFLCTATHDPDSADMALTTAPITIGPHAWIGADSFVGPGVVLGEGAVLGARSSAFRSVTAWTIVAGSPAHVLRMRKRAVADHPSRNDQLRE